MISNSIKKGLLRCIVGSQSFSLRFSSAKFRYQPAIDGLPWSQVRPSVTRSCDDRLDIIKKHLPPSSRNIFDIGSNTGYYLFELAKLGYLCHGLESDADLVYYTALSTFLLDAKRVSCECGTLDPSFVERMPSFDVIICLSVMHHIILSEGMDFAEQVLKALASKTNHVLFFEMGQSNEIEADWSVRLPAMEPDPQTWISKWLLKSGYHKVQTIGTSQTTVPRFLFAASHD